MIIIIDQFTVWKSSRLILLSVQRNAVLDSIENLKNETDLHKKINLLLLDRELRTKLSDEGFFLRDIFFFISNLTILCRRNNESRFDSDKSFDI